MLKPLFFFHDFLWHGEGWQQCLLIHVLGPVSKMKTCWTCLFLLGVATLVNTFTTGSPREVPGLEADEEIEDDSAAEEEDSPEDYRVGGTASLRDYYLKGQCHEIFDPRFFSANNPP
jgi:hypothetical protein